MLEAKTETAGRGDCRHLRHHGPSFYANPNPKLRQALLLLRRATEPTPGRSA